MIEEEEFEQFKAGLLGRLFREDSELHEFWPTITFAQKLVLLEVLTMELEEDTE